MTLPARDLFDRSCLRPRAMRAAILAALCVAAALPTGAYAPAGAQPGRPNIPTPKVSITPAQADVIPGGKVALEALAGGGEAIRFSIDWTLVEGAGAGTLTVEPDRPGETGISRATFLPAPTVGTGTVHVTAQLHQYPAAIAQATITLLPAPH